MSSSSTPQLLRWSNKSSIGLEATKHALSSDESVVLIKWLWTTNWEEDTKPCARSKKSLLDVGLAICIWIPSCSGGYIIFYMFINSQSYLFDNAAILFPFLSFRMGFDWSEQLELSSKLCFGERSTLGGRLELRCWLAVTEPTAMFGQGEFDMDEITSRVAKRINCSANKVHLDRWGMRDGKSIVKLM